MSEEKKNKKLLLNTAELLELREKDYDAFIDKLYETIVADDQAALEDPTDVSEKLAAIETLIKYYENAEEYERCGKLYELQKKMNG